MKGNDRIGFKKPYKKRKYTEVKDPALLSVFKKIGVPKSTKFKPDKFQIDAINTVKRTDCLVTAPTGSGKTYIAMRAIDNVFKELGRVWYTSPLKALSNNIYEQLVNEFGENNVGILTGDRKENTEAPIIIGTAEILRNILYDSMKNKNNIDIDLVIIDEAHFLGNTERGVVWEEILIYLHPNINILMLSATIKNSDTISNWLQSIRKKDCVIIEKDNRPVPLHYIYMHNDYNLHSLFDNNKKITDKVKGLNRYRHNSGNNLPNFGAIIEELRKNNLLPAIFFMKSRVECDKAVLKCNGNYLKGNLKKKRALGNRVDELSADNIYIANHKQKKDLVNKAVASHHSGQLPVWKLCVETLMSEGHLDAIFATSTVAAGVNFPARSIVIMNSDRYNGKEFVPLTSTELHQMTGRAGRRGKDNIGFTILFDGKFLDLEHIAKIYRQKANSINSQIHIDFSMVLNLLLSHSIDDIKTFLSKSFAYYQTKHITKNDEHGEKSVAVHSDLFNSFIKHLNFLKAYDYVDDNNNLTDTGKWTSNLRIDQPLIISECIRHDILPHTNPSLLASIISLFVMDRDVLSDDIFVDLLPEMETTVEKFNTKMLDFTTDITNNGFKLSIIDASHMMIIYDWISGLDWFELTKKYSVNDGDMYRLILRTIDSLRHLADLYCTFPDLANSANEAIKLLYREPITL